jgi:hypothetical protein
MLATRFDALAATGENCNIRNAAAAAMNVFIDHPLRSEYVEISGTTKRDYDETDYFALSRLVIGKIINHGKFMQSTGGVKAS